MKIVRAETILISIPFESGGLAPWGWGGAPANTFDTLLVRLETEDGRVGWGEAFSRMADVALKPVAAAVRRALRAGYRWIKLHDIALPVIRAACAAAGRDAKVMLDANCPWSVEEALAIDAEIADLGLHWFEEPVWPPENYAGLAAVRAAGRHRIAAGENAGSLHDFVAMHAAGAIDIAQPDVAKTGGVTELVKIAGFCEAHGLAFSPHCAIFGPGQIATIHLTAAEPRPPLCERLYLDFEAELFGEAAVVRNGRLKVPTGPGLGVDPDPAVIARYRVA
jgi:L-alanine-DL-glutamate epimerase-like enolase superfamily enzyme